MLILAKVVLQGTPIYWMHIFNLPMEIIHKCNAIITEFIWSSTGEKAKFHLTSLDNISKTLDFGGWGIKDIKSFNDALLTINIYRALVWGGI